MEGTYWEWGKVDLRWWEHMNGARGGRWLGQKSKFEAPGLSFGEHIAGGLVFGWRGLTGSGVK
jgi:hypothetical protein